MPVNRIDEIVIVTEEGRETLYWNNEYQMHGSRLSLEEVLLLLGYKVTVKEYIGENPDYPDLLSEIPKGDLL